MLTKIRFSFGFLKTGCWKVPLNSFLPMDVSSTSASPGIVKREAGSRRAGENTEVLQSVDPWNPSSHPKRGGWLNEQKLHLAGNIVFFQIPSEFILIQSYLDLLWTIGCRDIHFDPWVAVQFLISNIVPVNLIKTLLQLRLVS